MYQTVILIVIITISKGYDVSNYVALYRKEVYNNKVKYMRTWKILVMRSQIMKIKGLIKKQKKRRMLPGKVAKGNGRFGLII